MERYEKEKAEIKLAAEKLEADATAWDKQSDDQIHQHHRWAQATTVLQVAIALAAIALLTRKKWLEYGMFAVAAAGLVVGTLALPAYLIAKPLGLTEARSQNHLISPLHGLVRGA